MKLTYIPLVQLYKFSNTNLVMVVMLLEIIFCLSSRRSKNEKYANTVPRLHIANLLLVFKMYFIGSFGSSEY